MEFAVLILGLSFSVVGVYFGLLPVLDRTRRDFNRLQPNVGISGVSMQPSRHAQVARILISNDGSVVAYEGTFSLDGCPRTAHVSEIHPTGYGIRSSYEVSLELKPEFPIRSTRLENPRLWIRYRDRWKYVSELSYPVTQEQREDGLFDIRINTEDPRLRRQSVGFYKMRKHLRETPSHR